MKTRIALLVGAAAVYIAYRLYQNYRTKAGTQSLVKQLKKDPAVGEAFAEELSITVAKQAVSNTNWQQTLQPYLEGQQAANTAGRFCDTTRPNPCRWKLPFGHHCRLPRNLPSQPNIF